LTITLVTANRVASECCITCSTDDHVELVTSQLVVSEAQHCISVGTRGTENTDDGYGMSW